MRAIRVYATLTAVLLGFPALALSVAYLASPPPAPECYDFCGPRDYLELGGLITFPGFIGAWVISIGVTHRKISEQPVWRQVRPALIFLPITFPVGWLLGVTVVYMAALFLT